MKIKSLLWACFGGLLGVFTSCGTKMPSGELVSIEYTRSGTMAGYEYEGRVETKDDGTIVAQAMRESYCSLYQLVVDKKTLTDLQRIIVEEKMYAYKEHYRPLLEVLDGYMWSFHARFSDGESISSSGSNAAPSGDGLKRLREYFVRLANSPGAVQVEDEEGRP